MQQNIAKSTLVDRFAASLERYMGLREMNQPQLAQKSGVGQTTISLYLHPDRRLPGKSGKTPSPKLAEVEMLADALGVDPLALLGGDAAAEMTTGAPPEGGVFYAAPAPTLTGPEQAVLKLLSKLHLDEQGEAFNELRAFVSRRLADRLLEQDVDLSTFGKSPWPPSPPSPGNHRVQFSSAPKRTRSKEKKA